MSNQQLTPPHHHIHLTEQQQRSLDLMPHPLRGAIGGAAIGSACGVVGVVVGATIGGLVGLVCDEIDEWNEKGRKEFYSSLGLDEKKFR